MAAAVGKLDENNSGFLDGVPSCFFAKDNTSSFSGGTIGQGGDMRRAVCFRVQVKMRIFNQR
jgi:hypothetical protein